MVVGVESCSLRIKDFPAEDRPRERLVRCGAAALSNAELLAIIIRTGTKDVTAIDLAYKLLSFRGQAGDEGLRQLVEATVEELSSVKGVGLAKAVQVKAAIELGRRMGTAAGRRRSTVRTPEDVCRLLMEEMRYLDKEQFRTLLLNTKNELLRVELVSVGCLNSSIVHPREIFKGPIRWSAAAIVLVHNHPSGDPSPSREDTAVTRRLVEAGQLLGIDVLDHVVLGDNRFVSLKEKGLM